MFKYLIDADNQKKYAVGREEWKKRKVLMEKPIEKVKDSDIINLKNVNEENSVTEL